MRKKNLIAIRLKDLYILIYFLTFLIHYYTDFNFSLTFAIWAIAGAMGYVVLLNELKRHWNVMIMFLLIDIVAFVNILITHNHSPFNAFILPVSNIFGLYLYEYKKDMSWIIKIIYIILIYMFIYIIITPKTLANAWLGDWYTYFSTYMGGNTISIFLMLFLAIDLIYRTENNMKVNYIAILASLYMAYYGGGTGGVLSITVMLLALLGLKWGKGKISFGKIFLIIIGGICIISVLGKWEELVKLLTDSNSRFWMWEHYFQCATNSLKDLIFGGDVSHIPFLIKQKNMHNTFINWHYYYGLIPQILLIINVILTLIKSFQYKEYALFVVLCSFFIRAMTDETTFCFMPIWTFAALYIYDKKHNLLNRGLKE